MGSTSSPVSWTVAALGDGALLLGFGDRIDAALNDRVHAAKRWIEALAIDGILDLVPAYASLAVHFDPLRHTTRELAKRLTPPANGLGPATGQAARHIEIPVRYGGADGPDLAIVAATCHMSEDEVIARHQAAEYQVMFLGFSPGFAYLGGLDPALAIPRRDTPRRQVPAGSVGIGGAQTGIYPAASPGGWHLIGHTGARLFNAEATPPTLLQPGDRLRFVALRRPDSTRASASAHDTAVPRGPIPESSRASADADAASGFLVERPGLLTTVQDLGRHGFQHLGVSPGGAADQLSHRVANLIVGNDDGAATLEVTLLGPTLVAQRGLRIALCGAPFAATIDGEPFPLHRAVDVKAGSRIAIGSADRGARAYLAVAGGVNVPPVLNSRSTALRDHFGGLSGRALRAGDLVPVGDALPASGLAARSRVETIAPWNELLASAAPLRVLPGPEWQALTARAQTDMLQQTFSMSAQSDRMGLRLEGPTLALAMPRELLTAGVATGTIQLPPDGHPIVLLADRQTTGGYPRLGEVITADLPRLAQLRPGDSLRFAIVSEDVAREALLQQSRWLDGLKPSTDHAVG